MHNRLCHGCPHYDPFTDRVCVIKLGALGDVIRTLCILPELRRRYPTGQITWVTLPNACRMLESHPMIDRLIPFDPMATMVLGQESFDLVISLDKEAPPCALGMSLFAKKKLGIGLSNHGTPVPLNDQAYAYFHLGLSDELKFRQNTKSYPQLIYEALGWSYRGQRYRLPPIDKATLQRTRLMLSARGLARKAMTLGINVGAGQVFANKMWPAARIIDLIATVQKDMPAVQIALLGGPGERETIDRIIADLRRLGRDEGVIDTGTDHDEPSFVAVLEACDVVFTGDTMAMHVAIALDKPVIAFLGPTCPQEIDLFGQGEKLIAAPRCAPCYKRVCDHSDQCIHEVTTQQAVGAIRRVIEKSCNRDLSLPVAPLSLAG